MDKRLSKRYLPILLGVLGISLFKLEVVKAQSVTSAQDETGTVVIQNGQSFDIDEGSLSADGDNLFHSFQTFQPSNGEVVNFLAEPSIQNIFARIIGGDLAVIDGLIQISDSQANLFLMNPAGVIFGQNATLNLPSAFTVTTADGIGFETNWFSAVGSNDYLSLVGSPNAFAFTRSQPGVVLNEGTLTLSPSQTLTLLGGTVINTGELSAPGGQVTIATVPGEQIVRISQNGLLLNLEFAELTPQTLGSLDTNSPGFTPVMLPELLTSGVVNNASQLVANADGTVSLSGSTLAIPTESGTTIVSGTVNAANTALSGTGGAIAILGEQVAVLDAFLDASGPEGGGTILLGGDYQGQGITPRATQTFVGPDVAIAANAQANGNGGQIIIWADNTTEFWGQVSATGGLSNGDGGFVEISGKENLIFRGSVDVTASAPGSALGTLLLDPDDIRIVNGSEGANDNELLDNQVLFGDGAGEFTLSEAALENSLNTANVELQASNNIIIEDLSDNELTFSPGTGSIILTADADQNGIGDITIIDSNDTISAAGRSVQFSGVNLQLGSVTTASETSGNLVLSASQTVNAGNLITQSDQGTGGNVTITAGDSITAGNILTDGSASSGNVTLTSSGENSTILAGNILSEASNGVSGEVSLSSTEQVVGNVTGDLVINGEPSTVNDSDPLVDEPEEIDGDFEDFDEDFEDFDEDFEGLENELEESDEDTVGFEDDSDEFEGEFDEFEDEDSDEFDEFDEDSDEFDDEDSDEFEDDSDEFEDEDSDEFEDLPDEVVRTPLNNTNANAALQAVELQRTQEFTNYFGRDLGATELTPLQIQRLLTKVRTQTDNQAVVVYIKAPKPSIGSSATVSSPLELLIFTASGEPVSLTIPDISREELFQTIGQFRNTLITSARRGSKSYLKSAQQLYQWLIKPIEDELGAGSIDTILFSMDSGLRSLPIAALHDGQQFLIEKYSVGMMPTLGLVNTQYQTLKDGQVLAMGASDFQVLQPLPAVPLEIETIDQLWAGQEFLNETFTRQNLVQQRRQTPFQIVHLATHAEFKPGAAENSYIQLWNEQLNLDDVHTLGWDTPAVDLLVLSACRTAVGSVDAELGFAGLAVAAGVKSAMASLWAVDDVGTLALMSEFYQRLRDTRVKSEALRTAQLAMLNGETRIDAEQLISGEDRLAVSLPPDVPIPRNLDFSHPYYWSGFTMIGSPW